MTVYERFKGLPIDHGAVGLGQSDVGEPYYCTPKDAKIMGWAGVDGIHYCRIPQFGEMIFAVSPMNFGDCVHPIARNFEDLLRLLLFCGDMAAIEQCYAWDEEEFKAFMLDCPATVEQRTVLDVIRNEFDLEPMENAFAYIKTLQANFDLSRIPYTEDYFDEDMNPAAPPKSTEWKVTYDGGFHCNRGAPGTEIATNRTFRWGDEIWHIPAVYLCDRGLVVDYLLEVDTERVLAFIRKWDPFNDEHNPYTGEQLAQMQQEHPLYARFIGKAIFNGRMLQNAQGCSQMWMPACCLPKGSCLNPETARILEHYDLDPNRAWSFHRFSYAWGSAEGMNLQTLSIHMERQRENMAGRRFATPTVGESILLTHPLSGETHILTVNGVEQQELPEHPFRDSDMEYPNHFLVMSYSLEPDIPNPGFVLQDCASPDEPRHKKQNPYRTAGTSTAIGIIGGADGPTAVLTGRNAASLHAVCSALRFEPVEQVWWRPVFREKLVSDIDICLK